VRKPVQNRWGESGIVSEGVMKVAVQSATGIATERVAEFFRTF